MKETVAEKKQRIRKSAIEIFANKGSFTIRELSRKTNVNIASINYHFGSKENLLAEIELAMVNFLHELIDNVQSRDLDPFGAAQAFIDRAYVFFSDNPGFFRFIGGTLIDQNIPYEMKYIRQEVEGGPLKQFLYSLIEKGSGLSDKEEIENRCLIFFSSLALPMFQLQFADKGGFIYSLTKVTQKENFKSYMKSLMTMLMRK